MERKFAAVAQLRHKGSVKVDDTTTTTTTIIIKQHGDDPRGKQKFQSYRLHDKLMYLILIVAFIFTYIVYHQYSVLDSTSNNNNNNKNAKSIATLQTKTTPNQFPISFLHVIDPIMDHNNDDNNINRQQNHQQKLILESITQARDYAKSKSINVIVACGIFDNEKEFILSLPIINSVCNVQFPLQRSTATEYTHLSKIYPFLRDLIAGAQDATKNNNVENRYMILSDVGIGMSREFYTNLADDIKSSSTSSSLNTLVAMSVNRIEMSNIDQITSLSNNIDQYMTHEVKVPSCFIFRQDYSPKIIRAVGEMFLGYKPWQFIIHHYMINNLRNFYKDFGSFDNTLFDLGQIKNEKQNEQKATPPTEMELKYIQSHCPHSTLPSSTTTTTTTTTPINKYFYQNIMNCAATNLDYISFQEKHHEQQLMHKAQKLHQAEHERKQSQHEHVQAHQQQQQYHMQRHHEEKLRAQYLQQLQQGQNSHGQQHNNTAITTTSITSKIPPKISFLHVVNLYVNPISDTTQNPYAPLDKEQYFTLKSMKPAQKHAREQHIHVILACGIFEGEFEGSTQNDLIDDACTIKFSLYRSTASVYGPTLTQKLPFLRDLFIGAANATSSTKLLSSIPEAIQYMILTNSDIGLAQDFYSKVASKIWDPRTANKVFTINRVPIENHSSITKDSTMDDIYNLMSIQTTKHPGHDCFVFQRKLLSKAIHFACEMFVGHPPWGYTMQGRFGNVYGWGKGGYLNFPSDTNATFHLGGWGAWETNKQANDDIVIPNKVDRAYFTKACPEHPLPEPMSKYNYQNALNCGACNINYETFVKEYNENYNKEAETPTRHV